jgi:hypothetical protein
VLKSLGKILPILTFILFANVARSQSSLDNTIDTYIQELTAVWTKYDTISFNHFFDIDTLSKPNIAVTFVSPNTQIKNLQLAMNKQEQQIYKKDVGLTFVGLYQYNFKAPLADPEEIVVFRQKAQMGIDWSFLNGGFYENRIRYQQLQSRYKAINSKKIEENLAKFQQKNVQEIISFFNKHKIQILEKRQALISEQKITTEKLYALKHLTRDSYIKLLQHETDIYGQMNLYRGYNEASANLPKSENPIKNIPPLVDIDVNKLFQLTNVSTEDSSALYEIEALKQGNYFFRDMTLRANVKYNFYDLYNQAQPNRHYVSLGMNFGIPLAFNYSNKKELDRLRGEMLLAQKLAPQTEDVNYTFVNIFYEYRYKLKQYFNLMEKRKVFEELIRTEQVKQQMSDVEFNPNTALYILDDYWSTTIELLDLKQDLYKLLLQLNAKLPDHVINDFVKPVNISQYAQPLEKPFKAVYIWSDAFKNHDIKMISDYCQLNEFNHLLVSYNTDNLHLQKVNQFIAKNYYNDIAMMIGSNKLLLDGNITSYLEEMKSNVEMSFIKEIHLDIEPHTMEGFQERKDSYFAKYVQLLQQVREFCSKNKLRLSISIPLHYPESVLKEIIPLCDNVYLMAYENIKPEFIAEKIKVEQQLGGNKIVIALRTKDFENRAAMDTHFKTLKATKMAYHDLDDLLNFDNTSINSKDK